MASLPQTNWHITINHVILFAYLYLSGEQLIEVGDGTQQPFKADDVL